SNTRKERSLPRARPNVVVPVPDAPEMSILNVTFHPATKKCVLHRDPKATHQHKLTISMQMRTHPLQVFQSLQHRSFFVGRPVRPLRPASRRAMPHFHTIRTAAR